MGGDRVPQKRSRRLGQAEVTGRQTVLRVIAFLSPERMPEKWSQPGGIFAEVKALAGAGPSTVAVMSMAAGIRGEEQAEVVAALRGLGVLAAKRYDVGRRIAPDPEEMARHLLRVVVCEYPAATAEELGDALRTVAATLEEAAVLVSRKDG